MFRLTTKVTHMTTAQATSAALAEAVRGAVKVSGLSQRAVADESGIPLVTLNRKLNGTGSFTVLELAAISEVIGVSVTELALRAERISPLKATA